MNNNIQFTHLKIKQTIAPDGNRTYDTQHQGNRLNRYAIRTMEKKI